MLNVLVCNTVLTRHDEGWAHWGYKIGWQGRIRWQYSWCTVILWMMLCLDPPWILILSLRVLFVLNILHALEWSHVFERSNVPGNCVFKGIRLTLLIFKLKWVWWLIFNLSVILSWWLSQWLVWFTIQYIFLAFLRWFILFGFRWLVDLWVLIILNQFLTYGMIICFIVLPKPFCIRPIVTIPTTTN